MIMTITAMTTTTPIITDTGIGSDSMPLDGPTLTGKAKHTQTYH